MSAAGQHQVIAAFVADVLAGAAGQPRASPARARSATHGRGSSGRAGVLGPPAS